jgi:hypothetical protein
MPLAVEAIIHEDIALNSIEGIDDMSTQPLSQCYITTASMEEMQTEKYWIKQLKQSQQIKENIFRLRAKVSCAVVQEDCATVTPLEQVAL